MKKNILFFALTVLSACSPNAHENQLTDTSTDNSIVGGEIADNEVFAKNVVAIYNKELKYWCTGTVISKDIVLTAAHCLNHGNRFSYQVIFSKTPRVSQQEVRSVANLTYHKDYQETAYNNRNDIGLLRLKGSLPPGFEPMNLPTIEDINHKEKNFYAAGYGLTTAKRDSTTSDSGILRFTTQQIAGTPLSGSQNQFIVNQRNGHGICFGDSGGPAFMKFSNRRVVMGVASAVHSPRYVDRTAPGFDICRYDAIYTSVFSYLGWIAKATAEIRRGLGLRKI